MAERTAPLGPPDHSYPVEDYELLMPDLDHVTDAIRVEKLAFRPLRDKRAMESYVQQGTPLTFDAEIVFAIKGDSWPLELKYDVDFISTVPCFQGPHGE